MSAKTAIYGADGFGREVLQIVKRIDGSELDVVFVDDSLEKSNQTIAGVKVVNFETALKDNRKFVVAIADTKVRKLLVSKIETRDGQFRSIVAPSAFVADEAKIGEGAILCDNVIVTANGVIGKHFHANIYSYVAHDCVIADFVTFAPRVNCNGRVAVGSGAYIGTAAIIRQGSHHNTTEIGANAVVGMGAVVLSNVEAGSTVVGNPAKVIKKL